MNEFIHAAPMYIYPNAVSMEDSLASVCIYFSETWIQCMKTENLNYF